MLRPRPLLATLVAVALLAGLARAQSTNGMLPDPIDDENVTAYGRMLGLSSSQRLAVDRVHEQYLADFRALRETEIAEVMGARSISMRRLLYGPEPGAVRRTLDDLDRLDRRIAALDRAFFDAVLPTLDDSQRATMPRVREHRLRARMLRGFAWLATAASPAARVELGPLVDALDLPGDQTARMTPLVVEYERQRTVALRRERAAAGDALVDAAERVTAVMTHGRPAGVRSRDVVRDAWDAAAVDLVARVGDLAAVNRRGHRAFVAALDESRADVLTAAFLEAGYRGLAAEVPFHFARYEHALATSDLGPEERTALVDARRRYRARFAHLADRMMDAEDARRAQSLPFLYASPGRPKETDGGDGLRAERDQLAREIQATLREILGPERLDTLLAAAGPEPPRAEATVPPRHRLLPTTIPLPALAGPPAGPDEFVPGMIAREDVDRYSTWLALDDDERLVVSMLHDDYRMAFETLARDHLDPLRGARTALRAATRHDTDGPLLADRLRARRVAALTAIAALDETFLDDVDTAVAGTAARASAMQRVRLARQRDTHNRPRGGAAAMLAVRQRVAAKTAGPRWPESEIDLARLVPAIGEVTPAADEVLARYEAESAPLFASRHAIAMNDQGVIELRRVTPRQGPRSRPAMPDRAPGNDAALAIEALNRRTLERLGGALAPTVLAAVQRGYRRAAYPDVHDVETSAEPRLRSSLALDDLTGQQRDRLTALLGTYLEPHDAIMTEIVELTRRGLEGQRGSTGHWQERTRRREQRELLDFHRTELDAKTNRRLRAILTEPQRARLGLPADE